MSRSWLSTDISRLDLDLDLVILGPTFYLYRKLKDRFFKFKLLKSYLVPYDFLMDFINDQGTPKIRYVWISVVLLKTNLFQVSGKHSNIASSAAIEETLKDGDYFNLKY